MTHYLATTGISEIWDLDESLLLLGPWCLTNNGNKKLLENRKFYLVPSPWKPVIKIKIAADYCQKIYGELLPQLSECLNSIHKTSYPKRYWQILIGPWLLQFIEVFYERYNRIENALKLFPGFFTYVLAQEQCKLSHSDTYDFFQSINRDYDNLKLFSIIGNHLCPKNVVVKDYRPEDKTITTAVIMQRPIATLAKDSILLTNMYHLNRLDMFFIKWKVGFKKLYFVDFKPIGKKFIEIKYSYENRKGINLNLSGDNFQHLLYRILPEAIPMCYMENYKFYKESIGDIENIYSVKTIGSAVGWYFNERLKFFAAEAAQAGAKLLDFQHGGGYGVSLTAPLEVMSLEKDIFYTWGWKLNNDNRVKPLPSSHLSKLTNRHFEKVNKILFINVSMPKYHYRFHTLIQPDDMPKYLTDEKVFFRNLKDEIKNKILYQPYPEEYGWGGLDIIQKTYPEIKLISKDKPVYWMQKVKMVVIDHPHTSFLEALTINVPCVFYWDHDVYLMRHEAERYFEDLRNMGILYRDAKSAAEKVNQVFNNAIEWWSDKKIQDARLKFCERFAYARKDWVKVWAEEFKHV